MALTNDTSFFNNPLVMAIGSHLGLDPVFNQANSMRPGMSRPSPAMSRDLPSAQLRLMRLMQAGSGMRGGTEEPAMAEQPVMSPETLQDPMVAATLKHFGVDNNVQVDPNLFVHNQGAMQKHPVLSGLLENALTGLAFTQGSDTVGEGLSNVARGLMAGQAAHAQRINSQLMMPFQQAQQVANLRGLQQTEEERQAQIQEANSRSKYWDSLADLKSQTPVNPIWNLMQQISDASAKGDTGSYNRLLGVYNALEGQLHPVRGFAPPQGLNAARSAQWAKIEQDLMKQYNVTDFNAVPSDAAWDAYNKFLLAERNTKFPPKGMGGYKTDAPSLALRQSLIDAATDQIASIDNQLRQAGPNGYIVQGNVVGLKGKSGMITTQDLVDYKNRLVSKLNAQLTSKHLQPLDVRFNTNDTRPSYQQPTASMGAGTGGTVPYVDPAKPGYVYHIPTSEEKAFLKAHPNAKPAK